MILLATIGLVLFRLKSKLVSPREQLILTAEVSRTFNKAAG